MYALSQLIEKLDYSLTRSLKRGVVACHDNHIAQVGPLDLLPPLLQDPDSTLPPLFNHYDIAINPFLEALEEDQARRATPTAGTPVLDPALILCFERAWLAATLAHQEDAISPVLYFACLILYEDAYGALCTTHPPFRQFSPALLQQDLIHFLRARPTRGASIHV